MEKEELAKWWCGLKVDEKIDITRKAYIKGKDDSAKGMDHYPTCSHWWNSISGERKESIYRHCTDKHGMLLKEWSEGITYSY